MTRVTGAGLILAATVLASACSTTVDGQASGPASLTAPSSSSPVPAGLDVGEYPTTLYQVPQGEITAAWTAEGNRMLATLIEPMDIDPTLVATPKAREPYPVTTLAASTTLPSYVGYLTRDAKVGVALVRADKAEAPTTEVSVAAVRMAEVADGPQALATARTVSRSSAVIPGLTDGVVHEEAPGEINILFVRGPLLMNINVKAPTAARAVELAADLYRRQTVETSRFTPTATQAITAVPLDREGVLARALHLGMEVTELEQRRIGLLTLPVFERRGGNPKQTAMLREAGVDLVGWNNSIVLRTRDSAAALRLFDQLREASKRTQVEGVIGLSVPVQCSRGDSGEDNTCTLAVGRFVAQVQASDLTAVRQAAAAQWTILTRNP
ncbi:hypothetical protein HWD35_24595 [Tsukamurella tyrosinosolvens]|uniref:DUF7373 family lipoprotein n=1 Tax=Tsukamurella TaxID=2060 RepID=UPI0010584BDB|nr:MULTISPECIES: hypothetical protein [Tsukamurella]MCA4997902.1 hypothetical protein [Tsukamurella tyrosinosolvens]